LASGSWETWMALVSNSVIFVPFLSFTRLAQLPWLYQGFNFTVV
jgi:hypothetical protein